MKLKMSSECLVSIIDNGMMAQVITNNNKVNGEDQLNSAAAALL